MARVTKNREAELLERDIALEELKELKQDISTQKEKIEKEQYILHELEKDYKRRKATYKNYLNIKADKKGFKVMFEV